MIVVVADVANSRLAASSGAVSAQNISSRTSVSEAPPLWGTRGTPLRRHLIFDAEKARAQYREHQDNRATTAETSEESLILVARSESDLAGSNCVEGHQEREKERRYAAAEKPGEIERLNPIHGRVRRQKN
jgi:hypothetical protein